jgi:hypothetical protein
MAEKETKGTEAEQLDALAKKHEELLIFKTKSGVLALKPPAASDYHRFVDGVGGDGSKYSAMKVLLLACRVYPDRASAVALIEKQPALVVKAAGELQELGGSECESETKKG